MNKKIGIIFLSLVGAVVIFLILIGLQNKIIFPHGETTVYYAKKYIGKNTEITKDNIHTYLEKKKVSSDNLVESSIISEKGIINMYVTNDILSGEQISSKRIEKMSNRVKDIKNLREYSLKFSDISEVVGGTLREGDVIDLILTDNSQGKVVTQTELKNVVVDKAITTDGNIIHRASANKYSATVLNLDLSAEDAHKLDNAVARGKVKALKILDKSTYDDITIENSKM